MVDVSVIVPTWNEEACIEACLRAIAEQKTAASYELIVCDAQSEDGTAEIAERYADKLVAAKARSPASGRNTGAMHAKADILIFIDADTIIPPDYIDGAYEKFRKDPKLLGFSAGFVFSKRSEKLIFTEKVTNSYLAFRQKVGLGTLTGFNIAVRKEAFEKLEGFRDVPLEDGEFSIRLRKNGKVGYFTDIYVITSSRRLEELGLLGTIRYYLEMDLARRDPGIGRLLRYSDYVKCKFDDHALQEEFTRVFSDPATSDADITIREYIKSKADSFYERMQMTSEQLSGKITESTGLIADLKLKARVSKDDVDRAIKLIKDRIR